MKTKTFRELIDRVVKDKVQIEIRITPEEETITIEPWKPFEMKCPYQPILVSTPKETWIPTWKQSDITVTSTSEVK